MSVIVIMIIDVITVQKNIFLVLEKNVVEKMIVKEFTTFMRLNWLDIHSDNDPKSTI